MNRFVFAAVILLLIGACVLPSLTPAPDISQVVDTAGTAESMMKTAVIQTLTAQPTSTSAPVVSSATPTLHPEVAASSPTFTGTSIIESMPAEATGTFEIPTATDIPATLPLGSSTATLTPGVLTYGTLPPAVPFSNITLINRARAQAYISLQVVTEEGGPTIIEYPVSGQIKVKAPVGHYLYVAWVGGRQLVGEFRLHKNEDLKILLYRDKVVIR